MNKLSLAIISLTLLALPLSAASPAPVILNSAGNFAVLAATTVTSTGGTTVVGDLGIWPGSALTGFPPASITGALHIDDPISKQAQADLLAAYNDAAGRSLNPIGVAGNLGGQTLPPGLYKSTSSLAVSSGNLTLDGQGDPGAVWIFQIATTLTTTTGLQVILINGAQDANIFWQVGTSATIGSSSTMHGTVMASQSITIVSGATFTGRALALVAAVTLDSNSVTLPATPQGRPAVSSTVPANNAVNVSISDSLSATFNMAMDPTTITTTTFTLMQGILPVVGTVTYVGTTAIFKPANPLPANSQFTATITTGAADPLGATLASNYVWTFTTGAAPDLTPPTVSSTAPANADINVPIGSSLSATFSEAMNPLTITASTFTLQQGANPVAGVVTYAGVTATFTPSATLAPNTLFTATITTGVQDLAGGTLPANYIWTFTTGAAPDITPPTVSSTVPASAATNVGISNSLSATFSEALNPLTVTTSTFTLQQGATPVAGAVTYSGVTATFSPLVPLAPNTLFTATITTGVTDLAGNALAANYVWTFTTGAAPDITPPTVSSTVPANAATNVGTGNTLSATFSEALNPLTVTTNTFTLKQGATPVAGAVTYAGTTATFNPLAALAPNALYTATITTGVTDLAGNALAANYIWTFTTGAAPDLTPPTVSSTVPANAATNVGISNSLSATFSEALNPLTVTTNTFTLKQGATPVAGAVTYAGTTATFTPSAALAPNMLFTATITTGVTDLAGNALVANYVWTFTTGSGPDLTPPTVSSTVPANAATNVGVSNGLSATFNEALNPLTVTTNTFTLQQGATPVAGAVTYSGVTATFSPLAPLAPNMLFTATITTGVTDLAGGALAANYVWTFTTGAGPDLTPPTVSSTVPANAATNVGISNSLSATFSEALNPLTVTTNTFTLRQGVTPVAGAVTYAGVTATFTPLVPLAPNMLFTATITTGVTDLAGGTLPANYVWTFTTGAAPDITPPTVISTVPASGATNVGISNSLSATFSEALNPLTVTTNTFTLRQGATPVAGAVTYSGVTATFSPLATLAPNMLFTATITTGVTDLAGNALVANYVWTFTTGAAPDVTPPTVISTVPANGATNVGISNGLSATFSEALNPLTVTTNTFTLKQGATPIAGSVTYAGVTATFSPLATLSFNTLYTATITTGVTDLAGNALAANYVWTFTTGPVPNPPMLSVLKQHSGSFMQGQIGALYTVSLINQAGAGPTTGVVTVTDTIPTGLTLISMGGLGWSCSGNTCSRSDALPPGAYPITVTVNVAANAPAQVINQAGVSGGGSPNGSASDVTTISASGQAPPAVTIVSPSQGATGVSPAASLIWGAVPGATSYNVYFGTSTAPPLVTNTAGTSYSPALNPGTTYYWSVTAVNSFGSTPSALFSFTVALPAACSFIVSPAFASLPSTGTSTVETCPNNSGQPNCGVIPETPRTFTVTPSAACGAWTATSSNPAVLQITSGANGSGGSVGFVLLNNTHTGQQDYTITVASATTSAAYCVTEAGSGDNQVYREVYALYEQLLGRDPDSAGFAFWTGVGGAGLGQMADSFLTSPESFDSNFAVMAAYQAATGAPPTYAQFTAAVTSIRSQTQTVPGLFNSLIGPGYTAATLYGNLLNRAPAAADSSCTSMTLVNCFQTITGFPSNMTPVDATNSEFQSTGTYHTTLAADHTNALYVQMLYDVTLSRHSDASGLAFWTGIANSGGPGLLFYGNAGLPTRIQILGPGTPSQGFIGSPEFQGLFVN